MRKTENKIAIFVRITNISQMSTGKTSKLTTDFCKLSKFRSKQQRFLSFERNQNTTNFGYKPTRNRCI